VLPLCEEPQTTFASAPAQPVVVNDYSKQKDVAVVQAEELVLHFHRVFHDVTSHAPQSRKPAKTLSLVSRLGIERAKYTIEFAKREADKTHYAIQHFGRHLKLRLARHRGIRLSPAEPGR